MADAHELPAAAEICQRYALFGTGDYSHPLTFDGGSPQCQCAQCQRWAIFLRTGGPHSQPIYLLPTRELVHGLCTFLQREQQVLGATTTLRVLEVGAGDGTLSHHLKAALESASAPVMLRATDSFSRGLQAAPGAVVECADATDALVAHEPHVVICAFMPLGVDWTSAFRSCLSVRLYVMLGEVDDGCCGRPWATWGYLCDSDDDAADLTVSSTSSSEESDDEARGTKRRRMPNGGDSGGGDGDDGGDGGEGSHGASPGCAHLWRGVHAFAPERTPFGAEGWVRSDRELAHMSRELICCTDRCWDSTRHARAVVFRRRDRHALCDE